MNPTLLLLLFGLLIQSQLNGQNFGEMLSHSRPNLLNALAAFDQHEKLSDDVSKIRFWVKTKQSNKKDFYSELNEARQYLASTEFESFLKKIDELDSDIIELKKEISDYERQKLSAPESTWVKWSKATYEEKIEEKKEEIDTAVGKKNRLFENFIENLGNQSFPLSENQAFGLLYSESGRKFVEMGLVFKNVKGVTKEYLKLIEKNEDLVTAKEYYGTSVMLIQLLLHIQQEFISEVDNIFIPRVNRFVEKCGSNIADAQKGMQSGNNEDIYLANITSNRTNIDVANYHITVLKEQRDKVQASRKSLLKDLDAAVNTYNTVKASQTLVEVVAPSTKIFSIIEGFETPELRIFNNELVENQFEDIIFIIENEQH